MRFLTTAALVAIAAATALAQAPATSTTTTTAELKVGDQAPDFSLQASDGKTYKLSDFKGKKAVVVAWFPKALTAGCTIECKSLAEHGDMIRKYNVEYFMASVDPIDKNIEFAKAKSVDLGGTRGVVEKKEADFPILSDPTKATATAYGVLGQSGVANRWTFYIGKDGKIQAIEKTITPAPSAEDLPAKLGELHVEPAKK
jgi:peroxiredoxin Q/BCP